MAPPESALKAVGLQQNGLFLAVSLAAAFGVSGTPTRPCGRGWVGAAVAASRDSGTLQSVWTAGGRWYRSWKVLHAARKPNPGLQATGPGHSRTRQLVDAACGPVNCSGEQEPAAAGRETGQGGGEQGVRREREHEHEA